MTRLETLKKLEATLESFLTQIVVSQSRQVEFSKGLDALDEITRDSLKGRRINSRLGNWFAKNNNVPEDERLRESEILAIAGMLGQIKTGLDVSDPESRKLADEIDRWHDKGIIPRRKLILKMKPSEEEPGISEKFAELLNKEAEYFSKDLDNKKHLLSLLDDVLKSTEAKEDTIYIHLAGSIIYFLKMRGYKVGPFVKRLKEIEGNKLESPHAY